MFYMDPRTRLCSRAGVSTTTRHTHDQCTTYIPKNAESVRLLPIVGHRHHQLRGIATALGSRKDDNVHGTTGAFGGKLPDFLRHLLKQQPQQQDDSSSSSWCSAERVISDHEEFAAGIAKKIGASTFAISGSFSVNTKRASSFGPPTALARCDPVYIKELRLNSEHRGRVLKGTLRVDPFVISSIHTVLVDGNGDALKVRLRMLQRVPFLLLAPPATQATLLHNPACRASVRATCAQ
jgi:hypothetical protein